MLYSNVFRRIYQNLIVLLCLASVSYGLAADVDALMSHLGIQALSPKKRAPAFSLLDLQGKKVSLEGYRGKTVMLYFWMTG